MATAKKRSNSKKQISKAVKPRSSNTRAASYLQQIKVRSQSFLARRPHRSFRRTRRRDYVRPLLLPGYISFTNYVLRTLRAYTSTYLWLVFVFALASSLIVGLASQESFQSLAESVSEAGQNIFEGGWGEIGKASVLLVAGMEGAFSTTNSDVQQVFAAILGLLAWLTTVWLLRAQLAGKSPRLRDGLYSAGSPIVSVTLLSLLLLIQLVPIVIAVIGYNVALETDLIANGVIAFLIFVIAALLTVLSLYLMTSTLIAMVVVTLPGMYPWHALRVAGDLVVGRRLRILLRFVWLAFIVTLAWAIIMIPVIIFASWLITVLPQLAWVPIVPIILLLVSSASIVFAASYIYLLYRKVVDDDTSPA